MTSTELLHAIAEEKREREARVYPVDDRVSDYTLDLLNMMEGRESRDGGWMEAEVKVVERYSSALDRIADEVERLHATALRTKIGRRSPRDFDEGLDERCALAYYKIGTATERILLKAWRLPLAPRTEAGPYHPARHTRTRHATRRGARRRSPR